jgi:hypothetical protein
MSRVPDPKAVYVSPLGRRCAYVPATRHNEQRLFFRYLDNTEAWGGGFTLTQANFRLMREHAGPRWAGGIRAPAR